MEIDLLDGALYVNDPYPTYAWMRANAPAYWDATNELWGISRYDDIVEIEKRKDVFVNSDQDEGRLPAQHPGRPLDHRPRRPQARRASQPRRPAASRPGPSARGTTTSARRSTALVDGVEANGGRVDVVDDLAAPLPALMIGLLLGFPDEAWPELKEWSERTIHLGGGPRYHDEDGIAAAMEFARRRAELYEAKKACPADDVMSIWTSRSRNGA